MSLRIWCAWYDGRLLGAATVKHELKQWLLYMKRTKGALWPPLDDIKLEAIPNRSVNKSEVA